MQKMKTADNVVLWLIPVPKHYKIALLLILTAFLKAGKN